MPSKNLLRFAAVIAAVCLVPRGASALPLPDVPPPASPVVEYYNTFLGHYFYTAFPEEALAIDAGAAGPGWTRTGLAFAAYLTPGDSRRPLGGTTCVQDASPCVPVSRFYASGPSSHFFTGNAAEAEFLRQPGSGWKFEGIAFHVPLPQAGGCRSELYPVRRFYNNGFSSNNTNHRFTASAAAAQQMRAQGWTDEGIAFCAYRTFAEPLWVKRHAVTSAAEIGTVAQCKAEPAAPRSCVATSNVRVPSVSYPPPPSDLHTDISTDEFNVRTGIAQSGAQVSQNIGLAAIFRALAASDVFVQLTSPGSTLGIHLATRSRDAAPYSTMTPLVKLPSRAPAAGQADARFFPWRIGVGTEYELVFKTNIWLRSVFAEPGSFASGNAVIEFVDSRSGERFRFNVVAYMTFRAGDFIGRDAKDGVVIVGAGSPASRYSRDTSLSFPMVSFPIVLSRTDYFNLAPNHLSFHINRAEFAAILAAARSVDPRLSPEPTDYVLDHFGMHNEVVGDGEIGVTLQGASLAITPAQ